MSRRPTQLSRTNLSKSARTRFGANESQLRQFPFTDGRRCRMLRHPVHPNLCVFHARAELPQLEAERLGTELAQTLTGDFLAATDVNHALGRLYTAVAQNRIPTRTGATLAYIGHLLLHSVNTAKSEYRFSYKFDQWNQMNQDAKPLSLPPSLSLTPTTPPETTPASADIAIAVTEPAVAVVSADKPEVPK